MTNSIKQKLISLAMAQPSIYGPYTIIKIIRHRLNKINIFPKKFLKARNEKIIEIINEGIATFEGK